MTTSNLETLIAAKVTGSDVETLIGALEDTYERVHTADPEPMDVSAYLTDPAEQFVAVAAIDGTALSHNPATAKSLVGAINSLESFYDAELAPTRR